MRRVCVLAAALLLAAPTHADIAAVYQAFRVNQLKAFDARAQSAAEVYAPLLAYWRGVMLLRRDQPDDIIRYAENGESPYLRATARRDIILRHFADKNWQAFSGYVKAQDGECATALAALAGADADAPSPPELSERIKHLWRADNKFRDEICGGLYQRARADGVLSDDDVWLKIRHTAGAEKLSITRRLLRLFPNYIRYQDARKVVRDATAYIRGKHSLKSRARRELVMIAAMVAARRSPETAIARWEKFSQYYSESDNQYVWTQLAHWAARWHRDDALELYARGKDQYATDESRAWAMRAALRADDYAAALAIYETMPTAQQSISAWQYWSAVAMEKTSGATTLAQRQLIGLAQRDDDFYGLLAREAVGLPLIAIDNPAANEPPNHSARVKTTIETSTTASATTSTIVTQPSSVLENDGQTSARNEVTELDFIEEAAPIYVVGDWAIALSLYADGLTSLARKFWRHAGRAETDEALRLSAAERAREMGWHLASINAANRSALATAHSLRFPTPYADEILKHSERLALDAAYVFAIIRQESRFMPQIQSSANARGLMQVMPATARYVARKYDYSKYRLSRLKRVDTNVTIGTRYMAELADSFAGHPGKVATAYNAGPTRVARWWRASDDTLVAIENIPVTETRLYVKHIAANRLHYKLVFGETLPRFRDLIETPIRVN